MKKENGGAAFPCAGSSRKNDYGDTINDLPRSGMTLRDYFAAKAMSASLSARNWDKDSLAEQSYKMADAMLKARGAE